MNDSETPKPRLDGMGARQPVRPRAVRVTQNPSFTTRSVQVSSPNSPATKLPRRKFRSGRLGFVTPKRVILLIAGLLAIVIIVSVGWVGWKFIRNSYKIFGVNGGSVLGLLSTDKLKGEDVGRVNILLAGNSADDPGHGGALLTDSIMLVSVDTKNNTAFMISIPRDLWVNIPGNGYSKINAAYEYGVNEKFSAPGYPAGGMGLLEDTVSKYFNIPINYYALVNYTAFRDGVNAVGGIDVVIKSPDPRGIYDPNIAKSDQGPLILKNGLNHLSGQIALNLARARNDPTPTGLVGYGLPNGDFDRAADQRLMLIAIKNKIVSGNFLANPLKIGQLLDALGNNVITDFKTNDLRRLYDIGKNINSSSIQSLSLQDPTHGVTLLANYVSPDGQDALIPKAGITNFSQIQAYLAKITSENPIVKEGASVVVLNGSGVAGLAKKTATALGAQSINVTTYDNAPTGFTTTTLIDNSGGAMPDTKVLLGKLYHTSPGTDATLSSIYNSANFILILGSDQAATTTTPAQATTPTSN
ncbi:MAG: LCP family protein [Candidatus Saccharimonadia bacterium]